MNRKSKNWCFTINNPSEEDLKDMSTWLDKGVRGYAYEEEVGASGTPHYQGYLCFRGQQVLSKCRQLSKRAHWEPMKGSLKQNATYCSKEGKMVVVGKARRRMSPLRGDICRAQLSQLNWL